MLLLLNLVLMEYKIKMKQVLIVEVLVQNVQLIFVLMLLAQLHQETVTYLEFVILQQAVA